MRSEMAAQHPRAHADDFRDRAVGRANLLVVQERDNLVERRPSDRPTASRFRRPIAGRAETRVDSMDTSN